MLVQVGSLLAAAGVVVAALAFGGRAMSPSWAWLSYAIAIGFVVVGVLSIVDVLGDVSQWLTVLLTGILVPVWAFWLASTFRESNAAPGSTEVVATSPMSA
jgi:membrane-associated PAP2 superfamily phosphatase